MLNCSVRATIHSTRAKLRSCLNFSSNSFTAHNNCSQRALTINSEQSTESKEKKTGSRSSSATDKKSRMKGKLLYRTCAKARKKSFFSYVRYLKQYQQCFIRSESILFWAAEAEVKSNRKKTDRFRPFCTYEKPLTQKKLTHNNNQKVENKTRDQKHTKNKEIAANKSQPGT